MKIATPISNLFNNSTIAQEIIKQSHCLECRDHSLSSDFPNQEIIHFDYEIVHPWTTAQQDYVLKAISKKMDLQLISFHMASSCSFPEIKDGMYYCRGKNYEKVELLNHARDNIKSLQSICSSRNIKIAVENNNFYSTGAYQYITDPDFISEVVLDNNIQFVFDLAHAKITAHNKGQDYLDYFNKLPLERMIQIHISQYDINREGLAYDAHTLPDSQTLRESQNVIYDYAPEYITIEYYKESQGLISVLKQLQKYSYIGDVI